MNLIIASKADSASINLRDKIIGNVTVGKMWDI